MVDNHSFDDNVKAVAKLLNISYQDAKKFLMEEAAKKRQEPTKH